MTHFVFADVTKIFDKVKPRISVQGRRGPCLSGGPSGGKAPKFPENKMFQLHPYSAVRNGEMMDLLVLRLDWVNHHEKDNPPVVVVWEELKTMRKPKLINCTEREPTISDFPTKP